MAPESLSYLPRLGQSELIKPFRWTDNPTAVPPTPDVQLKKYPSGGTCSWRPAYLPSRVICLQAKKSGRGRRFRQRLFWGSATLSWSTPLLRSSRLDPSRIGFTDTANTTCLRVPSIGLIVAGDAAYNSDHLHLSESPDQQKRQEWIAALDKMESLKPRAVIAGHKRVGNDDSPRIIGETRKYIRDFERLATQTTTARELYDEMLKLYPDWINRAALWSSVRAIRS